MSNCLSILVEIYVKQNQNILGICALISLLQLHPSVPEHWAKLGILFKNLENAKIISCYCLLRAKKLHEAVEKTVIGFPHTKNLKEQKNLNEILEKNFDKELCQNLEAVVNKAVFGKLSNKTEDQENADFIDLGSSKLRKTKEEQNNKSQFSKNSVHPPLWTKDSRFAQNYIDDFIKLYTVEK